MQEEIEAKFLNVDHNNVRKKLKDLGAKISRPMTFMKRAMFDYPDGRFKRNVLPERLRVRDEGDRVTMTYKRDTDDSDYALESETIVGSFNEAVNILESIGLVRTSLMETKREVWEYDGVEIMLDEWPWLNTYIEVEGKSEQEIKNVVKLLGFEWDKAVFGPVDVAYYHQYPGMKKPESIGDFKEVRFDVKTPQYFIDRMDKK